MISPPPHFSSFLLISPTIRLDASTPITTPPPPCPPAAAWYPPEPHNIGDENTPSRNAAKIFAIRPSFWGPIPTIYH